MASTDEPRNVQNPSSCFLHLKESHGWDGGMKERAAREDERRQPIVAATEAN